MNKKEIHTINQRLDAIDGVFTDFHTLLNNHMSDFTAKFVELKTSVEKSIEGIKEINAERDRSNKFLLKVLATLTGISIGGLITLALWLACNGVPF